MTNKKKLVSFLIAAAITVCAAFPLYSSAAALPTAGHDANALKNLGIEMESASAPAKISSDEAKKKASELFPLYAKTAKNIKVQYHLHTNKGFQMIPDAVKEKNEKLKKDRHMSKTPAYLVTFEGIERDGHAPRGIEPVKLHEYNVVIDAESGEAIYGFSYR